MALLSCFQVYCCSVMTPDVQWNAYSARLHDVTLRHQDMTQNQQDRQVLLYARRLAATFIPPDRTSSFSSVVSKIVNKTVQLGKPSAVTSHGSLDSDQLYDCRRRYKSDCATAIHRCLRTYSPPPEEKCSQFPSAFASTELCTYVTSILSKTVDYTGSRSEMIPIFPVEVFSEIADESNDDMLNSRNFSFKLLRHEELENRFLRQEASLLWVYGMIIPVIAVLGIVGNLITTVIMTSKQMKSSINIYLAGLSVFDAILLFMTFFIYPPIPFCHQFNHRFACSFSGYPLLLTYPLSLIAQTGSVWTCVVVSADRFLAVCYPLKARSLCTVTRAKLILYLVGLFSIVFNIPTFFEIQIKHTTNEWPKNGTFPNITTGGVEPTELRENPSYQLYYKTYIYLLVMILLPLLFLVVLNALVMRTISVAFKKRQRMTRNEAKEHRATKMVVVIVICFIFLNFLAFVSNFIEAFVSRWRTQNFPEYMMMVQFANLFVTLNSGINFIIYCAMGHRFRKMFLRLFCSCCKPASTPAAAFSMWRQVCRGDRRENAGIISMRRMPTVRYGNGQVIGNQRQFDSHSQLHSADGGRTRNGQQSALSTNLALRPDSNWSQKSQNTTFSNVPSCYSLVPRESPTKGSDRTGSFGLNSRIEILGDHDQNFDFSQMKDVQKISLLKPDADP